MKVLQVSAYAAPYEGNFIKSLKELRIRLQKKGIEMIYAFPESAEQIPWCQKLSKDATVYFLPLAKARIIPRTYSMLKQIYRENPDIEIIHSHFELYDIPVVMTAAKHMKVFWHLHDAIEVYSDLKNRIINKLQYGMFHKKAVLLSVSEKHKEYVERLGFPKQSAYFVPNGLDISRIQLIDTERENRLYDFLMFGWEIERKGVDLCVEACKKMGDKTRVAIVGSQFVREEIKRRYGEVTNVEVIEPVININELYSNTRGFLHISRAEGLSYALLEAVYAGLPIVCSDIRENLFAKVLPTVNFVRSEDVDDIAQGMLDVVNRGDETASVEAARSIVEKEYSIESWTNKILTHYEV